MPTITHDYIKPNTIKERSYQINIYQSVKEKNSLVVLPTGLGKTIIAALVLAHRLPQGKIFFLAPTKPLCEQHATLLKNILTVDETDISLVTGEIHSKKKRQDIYNRSRIVVATPQTIENDLGQHLSLKDCSLIIFDEAHRSVGDYAYVPVAKWYRATAQNPQILGLTASPGSNFQKLVKVAKNLGLKHVEIRMEQDEDVQPYIPYRSMNWYLIDMPREVKEIRAKIDTLLNEYIIKLQTYTRQAKGLSTEKLSKRALIDIQQRIQKNLGKRGGIMYQALSLVSAAIKLAHLRDMVTSQGLTVARMYLNKLTKDTSRAAQKIRKSPLYAEIQNDILYMDPDHTKLTKTKDIIREHLKNYQKPKIIIFAEYRDTIDFLIAHIGKMVGIRATPFIGQARAKEGGMTQEQQKKTLENFRSGIFNVLVSTSIGEEGIDIPATTLVLFYEPVPSAIRYIQRKGRTARDGLPGEVKILIMKGSRDEAAYWRSTKNEKKMYNQVYKLKKELEQNPLPVFTGQTRIDYFKKTTSM
jgi:Fanconi anemia group M protein